MEIGYICRADETLKAYYREKWTYDHGLARWWYRDYVYSVRKEATEVEDLLWKRYGVYKPADLDIRAPYTAFELEW